MLIFYFSALTAKPITDDVDNDDDKDDDYILIHWAKNKLQLKSPELYPYYYLLFQVRLLSVWSFAFSPYAQKYACIDRQSVAMAVCIPNVFRTASGATSSMTKVKVASVEWMNE